MKDFNKVYKERYKKLNPAQRQAVDSIEGPVMVIAGPGTGKTSVLVMRIASILTNTDTSPDNILALTYTESGVFSMRTALIEIIGHEAHKVKINTFHGFCNTVINDFPEEFPEIIGAKHVSDSEQIKIIEEILNENIFQYLTPTGNPFYYVGNILSSIGSFKREGVDSEEFLKTVLKEEEVFYQQDNLYHTKGKHKGSMKSKAINEKKFIQKNKEFAKVFKAYQKKLRNIHGYDYEDMILEVVKKLESDKNFSLLVQEENHYILADEHQDANSAQNRVIKELGSFHSSSPNVFIVGDEKQAIFRFQGASLDNFMYFKNLYPDIKIIYLRRNYRSQQTILDVSQSLIESGASFDRTVHKPLRAVSKRKESKVSLIESDFVYQEALLVAEKVKTLIKKGTSPGEIAIIYRNHKDSSTFVRVLEKMSIPFILLSDKNLFEDIFIRKIVILLNAVCDPLSNEKLFRALHLELFNIKSIDALKVSRYASLRRVDLSSVLESREEIIKAGISDPFILRQTFQLIKEWNSQIYNKSIVYLLERVVYDSGLLKEAVNSSQSALALNRLRDFFKEAERFSDSNTMINLKNFVAHLEILESYGLPLKSSRLKIDNRVELLTAHSSKGREFDYVFIVNLIDKKWGNNRKRNLFRFPDKFSGTFNYGNNEDERRLLYVSLTRARKKVFLTYSNFREDGQGQLPSMFLADIDSQVFLKKEKTVAENSLEFFFKPSSLVGPSLIEKEYVIKTFLDQTLSVTALNAYLDCPWRYFYVNLMRIPGTYSLSQRFGIAVHESLREFFNIYKDSGDPGKNILLKFYKESLLSQMLTKTEEMNLLAKGEKVLSGYYETYSGNWRKEILTEKAIKDVSLDFDFLPKPLTLTGTIDKLEGSSNYTVIDYKTGKPKSRNFIEGKTKNSDGGIKRQLVFYKLLVDLSKEIEGTMSEGVIEFIEPNESGKYKRESFSVSNQDVKELRELIYQVSKEIYNLDFLDRTCENNKCEYCLMKRESFFNLQ
jgi:DNA helicase-2/ATP-dependent DNA helicase PcrA